jgi:hypothetical protein
MKHSKPVQQDRDNEWQEHAKATQHSMYVISKPRKGKSHGMRSSQRYVEITPLKAAYTVPTGLRGNSGQGMSSGTWLPLRHARATPLQMRPRVSTQLLTLISSDQITKPTLTMTKTMPSKQTKTLVEATADKHSQLR